MARSELRKEYKQALDELRLLWGAQPDTDEGGRRNIVLKRVRDLEAALFVC